MSENTQVIETIVESDEVYVDPDFTEDVELPTTKVVKNESVTPYKAAGLVNGWLEDAGIDKQLPPQMFYNYTVAKKRAGKNCVGGLVLTDDNKITVASLEAWFTKYSAKLTA